MMARAASGVIAATVARPRCLLVQTSNSAAPALSAVSLASQFLRSSSAVHWLASSVRTGFNRATSLRPSMLVSSFWRSMASARVNFGLDWSTSTIRWKRAGSAHWSKPILRSLIG